MTREEQIRNKAKELGQQYFPDSSNIWARSNVEACYVENACVEMAEWLDQHPHWIPVEERLPPLNNGPVLAVDYTGHVDKLIYTNDGWENSKVWCATKAITHWMPIVPPRKEE